MTLSCEIDHVLIGCPSLEDAKLWFERNTGVKPSPGGSHPTRGTCNALVSLAGQAYLELIAPDYNQSALSVAREESEKLGSPAFCWWAIRTTDLSRTREVLIDCDVICSPILEGSRRTIDGETVRWKLLMTADDDLGCQLPFFISWDKETQHPGAQSPEGSIDGLTFCGPDVARLEEILNAAGLKAGSVQCSRGATSQQHLDLSLGNTMHRIQGPDGPLPSLS